MFLASVGNKIVRDIKPSMLLQVSLIYANNTEEDILLKEQLDQYAAEHPNFKVGVSDFPCFIFALVLVLAAQSKQLLRQRMR
jgi:ferredoxin-NADP reductase